MKNKNPYPFATRYHNGGEYRKEKIRVLTLKWLNLDVENSAITLERTDTEYRKTRRIPINPVLRKQLLEKRLKGAG